MQLQGRAALLIQERRVFGRSEWKCSANAGGDVALDRCAVILAWDSCDARQYRRVAGPSQ